MKRDYNTCCGPFFPHSLKETRETGIVDWKDARQWSDEALGKIKFIIAYETGTKKESFAVFEIVSVSLSYAGTQMFEVREVSVPGKLREFKKGFRSGYGMLEDFLKPEGQG